MYTYNNNPLLVASLLTATLSSPQIGNLKNMKELGIQKNKIEGCLASGIGGCSSLETLHCEFNNLSELPKTFGKLKSLRKLYMNDNKFTKLHACIGKCPMIEVINAENNSIEKIAKRIKVRGGRSEATIVYKLRPHATVAQ